MILPAAALGAGEAAVSLQTAFGEPMALAVTWLDQPPGWMIALLVVTIVAMALQPNRPEPKSARPAA